MQACNFKLYDRPIRHVLPLVMAYFPSDFPSTKVIPG